LQACRRSGADELDPFPSRGSEKGNLPRSGISGWRKSSNVINRELLDALPFGRAPQTAALLTPGASAVTTFGAIEIGVTNIIMTGGGLTSVHGSRGGDSRVAIDGLSTSGADCSRPETT
jgi:hypothetical protein